jgi:predicted transcriptional regulator of viral defense system
MITDAEPIDADALRIRHEFLSAPHLRLSVDDVVAQLHVQPRHAMLLLESLVWEGFLGRTFDGQYIRSFSGEYRCEPQ